MTENRTPYETLQATIPTSHDRAILRDVQGQRRSSRHAGPGAAAVTQRYRNLIMMMLTVNDLWYNMYVGGQTDPLQLESTPGLRAVPLSRG